MNELRRALPFLLLPLLLFAAGCQLLPPGFLVPSPSPVPVAEATLDPSPSLAPSPSTPVDAITLDDLNDIRGRWRDAAIHHYTWIIDVRCVCPVDGRLTVRVDDEAVTSAHTEHGEPARGAVGNLEFTIDDLLQQVEIVLEDGGTATMTFDGHGVPVRVSTDRNPRRIDDDLDLAVIAFHAEEDPTPTITESRADLEARRDAWRDGGIDDYRWRVEHSCFCASPGPIDVVVRGGEVVDARLRNGDPVDGDLPLTVDALFAEMLRAVRTGGIVQAAYGDAGQPISVVLDYAPNADDDELYVQSRRFTPAP